MPPTRGGPGPGLPLPCPRRIQPGRLAHLTSARCAIETCFREDKQLLGLGDYEGHSRQGWHRHICYLLLNFFLPRGK